MKTEFQACEHPQCKGKAWPFCQLFCRYVAVRAVCRYGPNHQVAAQAMKDKPTYSLIGTAVLNRACKNLPLRKSAIYSMNQFLQNVQDHIVHKSK